MQIKHICVMEVIGITVNWQETSTSQCWNSWFIGWDRTITTNGLSERLGLPTGFEAGVYAFSLISSLPVPSCMQPLAPAEAFTQKWGSPGYPAHGSRPLLPNKALTHWDARWLSPAENQRDSQSFWIIWVFDLVELWTFEMLPAPPPPHLFALIDF